MPMIGNLHISLGRRCAVPTSPTLRFAPLLPRYHARIPLVVSRPSSTTPSSSTLKVSGELETFPLGISDFKKIRQPGLAYFDRTKYIPELQTKATDVQLICRPRRFGKSLTVTMLRYFHGFQFRGQYDELFKGLDVDEAVKNGKVKPGQYLVLEFDFSSVTRTPKIAESVEFLRREINLGLWRFKQHYNIHLGKEFRSDTSDFIDNDPAGNLRRLIEAVDLALQGIQKEGKKDHPLWDVHGIYLLADEYDAYANEYMDPHDPGPWINSEPFGILKAFWSCVKAGCKSSYGIRKVYITGVTPLLISGLTSGGNQENISFSPRMSTICGLTRSDVLGALSVICNEEEVQKHFKELQHHANGFHFCQDQSVDPVFNTQTALSYLQQVKLGERPQATTLPNSEISEPFLRICAGAPAAVKDMKFALRKDEHGSYQKIPCEPVLLGFNLDELRAQAVGGDDISAWRSLMIYMGGLTFDSDDPSNFSKIPNLVAAKRFGSAIIQRLGMYNSMKTALHSLARTGNLKDVLAGYRHMMQEHDVVGDAFLKKEEHHRDIIQWTILENPSLKPQGEYQVTKSINRPGYVDLIITDNKKLYTLIEFKNIQIAYLGLSGEENIDKAEQLEAMKLKEILGLKFEGDIFRTGTIRNWIDGHGWGAKSGEVRKQLQSYVTGPTMQKEIVGKDFRAFAAVIVGSRQILVREMDSHGDWVSEFQLAKWERDIGKQ